MKISADVICRVCKNVFCCEKCRQKHEIKNHAIVVQNSAQLSDKQESSKAIYLFCSICAKQPLTLKVHMYEEMLEHINANHLPLHCIKCDKLYTKIADLKEFTKCSVTSNVSKEQKCVLNQNSTKDSSKSGLTKTVTQITISTQTSPLRENDFDVVSHTPMSMLQLRWRTQSKITQGEFISDSVSSIKNISNISNSSIRRSIGVGPQVRGKLVRSTSTPVNTEFAVAKPKEPTFNSSGEHVSSIYGSGCDVESPAMQNPTGGTPSKQALDHKNRYRKTNRTKLPAVTPLRQVMSKSIQKAMFERGLCIPNTAEAPLDLRLSPAMRRTQSDVSDLSRRSSLLHKAQLHREHLSQKLTEQIVITKTKHLTSVESVTDRNSEIQSIKSNSNSNSTSSVQSSVDNASTTSNSVYQTCHSVEIITSTELSEVNIQKNSCATSAASAEAVDLLNPLKNFPKTEENNFDTITPITRKQKVLKKIIKFETPQIESQLDKDINTSTNSEVFYTPTSTPLRKSSIRSNTKNSDCSDVYKEAVPRNLSEKLSPRKKRPLIDDCAQIPTYNHIGSLSVDYDDDVFLPDIKNYGTDKNKDPSPSATTGAGRLWSFMSSVIRLPSFTGKRETNDDYDNNKHSLLKRCASIAGSLVRPKPLVDEEHLQSFKRKRTHTLDNQYQLDMGDPIKSPNADGCSVSSKRFRIYGRKPIDRMRVNYL
ncbi:mitosis initiation protein fs(1)Ya [Teleopsis dalmanni]|uniref:mitosis initiation protein fs(1)Ya n=1 Tax=Teleopsis dalmanni TaxID=139649 RepID=UPI0018CE5205|nr:mitosis initiation protein fs(1)Ya [Teleopsis dalmanni]